MNNEEMQTIANKIKNKTATPEEISSFTKAFKELAQDVKEDLTKDDSEK
ncbi:hypothetical protein K9M50_02260 [Patescibacteria group bacterium]|nr:hypothetical protein [Patescibacteria group bacterium]